MLGFMLPISVSQPRLTASDVEYPLLISQQTEPFSAAVFRPRLSDSGRYVLLTTASDQLDSQDSNGLSDLYRLDRLSGQYIRISVSGGVEGDRGVAGGEISADGQVVVFHSSAANLLPGDQNQALDIFAWQADRGPNQILERVSIGLDASPSNAGSLNAVLSGDGRYVAFSSQADNLVADDTNEASDIFVRDRQTGTSVRVSIASDGEQGDRGSFQPSISDDGRYVAFTSEATNFSDNEFDQLPDLFVHDRSTGLTSLINVSSANLRANADSANAVLAPDGSAVAFYSRATTLEPGFENIFFDVFVRDLLTQKTELISSAIEEPANANSFNPALSTRGQWVAFQSEAQNLTALDGNTFSDIYVVNRFTKDAYIASRRAAGTSANGGSFAANMVADGSLVAFESAATDLAAGGSGMPSAFVAPGASGGVQRLALAPPLLTPPNASLEQVSISTDGRYVALVSAADNLLPGDSNGLADGFVLDLQTRRGRLLSAAFTGGFVSGDEAAITQAAEVSDDGCKIVFASTLASSLLGVNPAIADTNASSDIFFRDDCGVGPLQLASVGLDGMATGSSAAVQPVISADGSWLAFSSAAPQLQTGSETQPVSQVYRRAFDGAGGLQQITTVDGLSAAFPSGQPQLSADGSIMVFVSQQANLDQGLLGDQQPAAGQSQVYRFDATTGQLQMLSRGTSGGAITAPDGPSGDPVLSADGRRVVFTSLAGNLVDGVSTTGQGLFLWQLGQGEESAVSAVAMTGSVSGFVRDPKLSDDGRLLLFVSDDPNLVAGDLNASPDVYALDLDSAELLALGRQSDGNLRPEGALGAVGISRRGSSYQAVYLAPSEGRSQLFFQPLIRSAPQAVLDTFVSSPLQSVQRGAFRLQVRNTGAVAIGAELGLQLTLSPLDHRLVDISDTPRWLCEAGPPTSCLFVGDAIMGDQIAPGGAEILTFQFDMFAGDQPLVSGAAVNLTALASSPPLAETLALTTQRVVSGVVVELQTSELLLPGAEGLSQVAVINGGQQPVSVISIDLAPLILGEPFHRFELAAAAPWTCRELTDLELPPLTRRCDYTGPPLQPNQQVLLTSALVLPAGVGRLLTRVGVSTDAQVIAPGPLQLMETQAPGLVFRGGFEG